MSSDPNSRAARFQQVRSIFDQAAALPAEERALFVRMNSEGDPRLEADVLKLLRSVESARQDGFLGEPAWKRSPAETPVKTGTWFGPYKVVRRLDAGGMGSVYLTVRADDAFRRQAALKIIRADCVTPDLIRRFHQERQLLAQIDHPNIARIVDGGTTADGLPYFVMDYIDGQHIHAYCTQRRLPVEARLAIFAKVCRAVEYLHRNQIIHRDLKPSNILVTADGVPKLVDFGIAKSLADAAADATRTAPLMTPGYASPEQLQGRPVGPASDVYSLGVVLYELLTGRRPYGSTGQQNVQQLISALETTVPAAPSEAAATNPLHVTPENPLQLRRRLSGDLDNILLLALRREPERRYASAGEFADDIERHLSGHAVFARRDAVTYRAGKYLRRNGLAAIAAAALLAVGGWGVFEHIGRLKAEERERDLLRHTRQEIAAAEARQAQFAGSARQLEDLQRVGTVYKDSFAEAIKLQPGMTPERRELADRAEQYLAKARTIGNLDATYKRELAGAYFWLADLRGLPGQPSLDDRAGALRLYAEARRLASSLDDDALAGQLLTGIISHEVATRNTP